MNNKKRVIRTMDIIFWGIVIIKAIIMFANDIIFVNTSLEINYIIFLFIILFLPYIFASILSVFQFFMLYIGIRIAYNKFYKEKLDKIDFKNDKYYRDIISKYSPGVLSYIDDFSIDESDIVATVMTLQLKQKVSIEDTIKLIDDSEENLDENEKYVLYKIKKNDLKNIDMPTFKNKVVNDCKKYNLLDEKSSETEAVLSCILIYTILIIGFIGITIFPDIVNQIFDAFKNPLLTFIVMIIFYMGPFTFPCIAIIYVNTYRAMNTIDPYVRNRKSKNINANLEGLRKYIKDYSLLDEKEHDALVMWDYYLIYSVILGQNIKVVDELMEKINNM